MSSNYYAVNASDLIHDVIGEAFRAAKLENYTRALANMDKPEPWQTWTLGMLIISACSFSAPLGMLILPCLSKALYERIMIFLIALGIGALSGSSMFIMLPQAFHLTQLNDFNYHSKSMIVVGALYVFFSVDRILQYGLELRRRRQAKRKVHTSTIVSIMSTSPTLKPRSGTVTTSDSTPSRKTTENSESPGGRRTDVQEKEKAELAEEVEIAMLNNAFARTFSTRRRLAVMNSIDGIELRDPRRRGSLGANVRNSFVQTVNNEISRNQDHFLDVVHTDVSRAISGSKRPSLADPPIPLSSKKSDDEVSVSVKIVEKHVIDPSTIEVASVAYMIIFGSSANNFVDGMSMGAAFSDSLLRGLSIGAAVVSQQFPQELGTLAILINSGLGFRRTMLYNMIPILLSYFGFICGVLLDNVDEDYDEFIFSISSGMYLYIFLGTLIPEIREGCNELMKVNMRESLLVTLLQYLGITSGICFMYYMSTVGEVEL
uniref:Membrane transporter n=1 Tax=Haemonchus contortus TaxID=6289 RepID=A0A7I4YR74_HAECO